MSRQVRCSIFRTDRQSTSACVFSTPTERSERGSGPTPISGHVSLPTPNGRDGFQTHFLYQHKRRRRFCPGRRGKAKIVRDAPAARACAQALLWRAHKSLHGPQGPLGRFLSQKARTAGVRWPLGPGLNEEEGLGSDSRAEEPGRPGPAGPARSSTSSFGIRSTLMARNRVAPGGPRAGGAGHPPFKRTLTHVGRLCQPMPAARFWLLARSR